MSYIIAVSSSKGGPGKTNTVANLADYWALKGKSVFVLDSDPNKNLSKWYSKKAIDNAFEGVELQTIEDEEKIIDAAEMAAREHDIVLIDVAGVRSRALLYAAGIADLVIVPAQPSEDDIDEAINTIEAVKNAAKLARRSVKYRVLLSQTRKGTIVLEHAARQFEEINKIQIFRTTIGQREAHKQARFYGTTVMRTEPNGPAAEDFKNLGKEVEKVLKTEDKPQQEAA